MCITECIGYTIFATCFGSQNHPQAIHQTSYIIELGIYMDPYLFTFLLYALVVFCLQCFKQVYELIAS
jgi:hypothetical protein